MHIISSAFIGEEDIVTGGNCYFIIASTCFGGFCTTILNDSALVS